VAELIEIDDRDVLASLEFLEDERIGRRALKFFTVFPCVEFPDRSGRIAVLPG